MSNVTKLLPTQTNDRLSTAGSLLCDVDNRIRVLRFAGRDQNISGEAESYAIAIEIILNDIRRDVAKAMEIIDMAEIAAHTPDEEGGAA